jgi:hypothetical protein
MPVGGAGSFLSLMLSMPQLIVDVFQHFLQLNDPLARRFTNHAYISPKIRACLRSLHHRFSPSLLFPDG